MLTWTKTQYWQLRKSVTNIEKFEGKERAKTPDPIEGEIKRPKTSSLLSKLAKTAAKKISEKYKRLCYGW